MYLNLITNVIGVLNLNLTRRFPLFYEDYARQHALTNRVVSSPGAKVVTLLGAGTGIEEVFLLHSGPHNCGLYGPR